ncbi:antibiotic biosynthesis monooxygenase [Psychromonas sp. B3M02]|uniref:putative quinol monooxygenase n=1 Tax=Psychromonas sp. B3M02 TaxID=2267226 RepID=UPI000DEA84F9|nr:putative quinol monooxygenase [Psychromonas sp. B3M02]RBW41394.1 antibiotic biosynthesis monooxygenase [Psychromonas sp. B3M02]
MTELTIAANIFVKVGKLDQVKGELLKLTQATRNEQGCIQYKLHQDNDNPLHFLFYETWESRTLWQAHMHHQNIKNYKAATEGCIESVSLSEMSDIS